MSEGRGKSSSIMIYDPEAVLPMFTSCCPAWVNYIEKSRPDLP